MGWIGREPAIGNYQVCDALTASATATYALAVGGVSVSPESANHMIVSLNGVIQKPVGSFTVSGSNIVFNSALTSSDSIDFIILLGSTLDVGIPSDASITNAKLASDLISGETDIGAGLADADLILVDDGAGGTLRKSALSRMKTYIGAGSDPSFHAYNPQNGSVASSTNVTISNNTELFDSDSAYNTSDYKFTPQTAGYYFLYGQVRWQSGDGQFDRLDLQIKKNGSAILASRNGHQDYTTVNISGMVSANGSSDYFTLEAYHTKGSDTSISTDDEYTYFGGFLIKAT